MNCSICLTELVPVRRFHSASVLSPYSVKVEMGTTHYTNQGPVEEMGAWVTDMDCPIHGYQCGKGDRCPTTAKIAGGGPWDGQKVYYIWNYEDDGKTFKLSRLGTYGVEVHKFSRCPDCTGHPPTFLWYGIDAVATSNVREELRDYQKYGSRLKDESKTDTMDMTEARGLAAGAWCDSRNSGKVMDVDLAESFAEILNNQVSDRDRQIKALRKAVYNPPGVMVHWLRQDGPMCKNIVGWGRKQHIFVGSLYNDLNEAIDKESHDVTCPVCLENLKEWKDTEDKLTLTATGEVSTLKGKFARIIKVPDSELQAWNNECQNNWDQRVSCLPQPTTEEQKQAAPPSVGWVKLGPGQPQSYKDLSEAMHSVAEPEKQETWRDRTPLL